MGSSSSLKKILTTLLLSFPHLFSLLILPSFGTLMTRAIWITVTTMVTWVTILQYYNVTMLHLLQITRIQVQRSLDVDTDDWM
ncbi:hypothetical protein KAX02_13825 [candidate division WOR-3 bacterium]|nr:hypothetical protein [candidate division WOR-3 bacterium]